MEAEVGLGMASCVSAFQLEGLTEYNPMTHERVVAAHGCWQQMAQHALSAAAAAPDAATAAVAWGYWSFGLLACPRKHRLPHFDPVVACGEGGERLRDNIDR